MISLEVTHQVLAALHYLKGNDMEKRRGLFSKIQSYSTKDGPGIRSTVFMIGCDLRCKWCANPEAMYPGKKIAYHEQKCMRCGCCIAHAASRSIRMGEHGCIIDRKNCSNLHDMIDICCYDAYEEIGIEMAPEELSKKLLRDRAFYDTSDGGITFSGGEPCLQYQFVYDTSRLLKKENIHIALDTAGLWDFDKVRPLLETADLILFDIKAFDSQLHKKCTGTDNSVILENAKRIAALGKDMYIRLVIVPGMNDDKNDIAKRLSFVKSLGSSVKQIDILKYHKLGIGKYKQLGIEYPLINTPECDDKFIGGIKKQAEDMNFKVTIGG